MDVKLKCFLQTEMQKKDFIPLEYFLDNQQHQTISILVNPKILQKILKLSADEIITLIIFQEYLHIIIKKIIWYSILYIIL